MHEDDTTEDVSNKCIDIEYKLHKDLINIEDWMNKNKLTINLTRHG